MFQTQRQTPRWVSIEDLHIWIVYVKFNAGIKQISPKQQAEDVTDETANLGIVNSKFVMHNKSVC